MFRLYHEWFLFLHTDQCLLLRIKPSETSKVDISAKLGSEEEKGTLELMMDEQQITHNFLIKDFDAQDVSSN